jgi:hypothetical protein
MTGRERKREEKERKNKKEIDVHNEKERGDPWKKKIGKINTLIVLVVPSQLCTA